MRDELSDLEESLKEFGVSQYTFYLKAKAEVFPLRAPEHGIRIELLITLLNLFDLLETTYVHSGIRPL